MTRFIVGTADLRMALKAVLPHTAPDPKIDTFHRVRLTPGPVNLEVQASQGYTAALAIASIHEHEHDDLDSFDLTPTTVKEILTLFTVGKDLENEALLRVEVGEETVEVTDISGLFTGKSAVLPLLPDHDWYPDVQGVIAHALQASHYLEGALCTNGPWVGTFATSAKVYKEPVLVTPVPGVRDRLLITCGESFIGVLLGIAHKDEGEDLVAEQITYRDAWTRRLTRVADDPEQITSWRPVEVVTPEEQTDE